MSMPTGPAEVNWDITYACPLRCTHCCSESGRRPSRQLNLDGMLRVADAIAAMRPSRVTLSGGEPMVVPGVLEVAERIRAAGIPISLHTSGWRLQPEMVDEVTRVFARINVSVDGASAEVHDRIRGRTGSFDRAMRALALLDDAAQRRLAAGQDPTPFGIDCAVVRSGFDRLADFCVTVAPRFPRLGFLWFAAAMPIGLASRKGFAEQELLTDAQADQMSSEAFTAWLQGLAPPTVSVSIVDSRTMLMDPARRQPPPYMQVEPDGAVRAFPIYEGTVGSLLEVPGIVLWQRGLLRWRHTSIGRALGGVSTMNDWAKAARHIDLQFATAKDKARINRRPLYPQALTSVERG